MACFKKGFFITLFGLSALLFSGGFSSQAKPYKDSADTGPGRIKKTAQSEEKKEGDKGEEAVIDHIVVICGHSDNKNKVTVNDYTKAQDGSWKKNWAVNGICGSNGISSEKKEGDKKTPEGFFAPTLTFGIKDDPGSGMHYHKIRRGDLWVDDPESPYYNRMVNASETPKNWNSAENMIEEAPYYHYGIALDYNSDGVPYKGSAIFIHCTKTDQDKYSAGCIRIPEEYMKTLIRSSDQNTRFFIMSDAKAWEEYKAKN
ncbi:MAG: L,D-transpeptidase family protein [Johnsonella sp.]|nr:L,D-transpeptidase family protein [Johnsonella sp.]